MQMQSTEPATPLDDAPLASTGVSGLDAILHGGFPRNDMHLVQGTAGTGKTTIALQFLQEGRRVGERTLYLTLSQSKQQLIRIANSHGWHLDGIDVHELSPAAVAERMSGTQTVFPTADVELVELVHGLEELVKLLLPQCVVIDSITILELIAGTAARYHE